MVPSISGPASAGHAGPPSTSGLPPSAAPAADATPSLFDPRHVPSLLPRIEHLVTLLLTASRDPHSLNEPLTPEQREAVRRTYEERARLAREAEKAARDAKGPNVALGASTEGDDEDTYSFFVGPQILGREGGNGEPAQGDQGSNVDGKQKEQGQDASSSAEPAAGARLPPPSSVQGTGTTLNEALLGRPTALREEIVREAQALKDAFASARRAIDALEGGDMGVDEQAHLIDVLAEYAKHQDQVRHALFQGSHALLPAHSA
ncbi:hypothetical protein OC842_002551 [Tilletia horrida]|uniref:Uncharacterized protein n=1 Tax=Tilletia horrida TaxID=155126 RepID=A0AAN6GDF5_9BASI|nr:hypothetical protein OC842_002551 [Tilletia horrida]KAK0564322.1 hypothetical protein OC844_001765 [Tilletia horrida]